MLIINFFKYNNDTYLHYSSMFFNKRRNIMWTKPEAVEMRYGFEVTMYVMNR